MIGGGEGAFIGEVHRKAIELCETAELVAACFSRNFEKNTITAQKYKLQKERVYTDYKQMASVESGREDKIDFVSIVTPNADHFEIAKAFLDAGIHVVCEKPLCLTRKQTEELKEQAESKKLLFAVTYTYTGYVMVKFAKELIERGEIGEIVNINAEYLQEWLLDDLNQQTGSGGRLSVWRKDPRKAGISNCVGDIGTHIEATVAYMTGLHPQKVAAALDRYGSALDLNANILVEFEKGIHGVFSCSQVCAGHLNDLRIRIFGTDGAIEWIQEEPERLRVAKRDEPIKIYERGTSSVTGNAEKNSWLPSGHPEGITIAFSNIYRAFFEAIYNKDMPKEQRDFPDVEEGSYGVRFIEAVVKSNAEGGRWTEL